MTVKKTTICHVIHVLPWCLINPLKKQVVQIIHERSIAENKLHLGYEEHSALNISIRNTTLFRVIIDADCKKHNRQMNTLHEENTSIYT